MPDDELPDVWAVNRVGRVAVRTDGETFPITNLLDEFGDECEPEDAVSAVAGPSPEGKWYAIDLSCFDAPARG